MIECHTTTTILCDNENRCNSTSNILLDDTYCFVFCEYGACTNKTIYFSANCKYSRFDIGNAGTSNTKVYFSGHFLITQFSKDTPCTDCSIYVGSLVDVISNETDFALSFPNNSIVESFNPSIYNFGAKLYMQGYFNSTDNLNIHCIGAVSYCILSARGSFGLVDSILFCEIDEIDSISASYSGNYYIELVAGIESGFPVDDWSLTSGCHFDCSPVNGCMVKLIVFFVFFTSGRN